MKNNLLFFKIFILFVFISAFFTLARADFTSPSFQLENPIESAGGGESSSPSFQYLSTTSQLTQGVSSSASFTQNAGFLYFPTASSPVLAATPGDSQVTLSWTTATGVLANITNYDVGVSTSSNGTYTFTPVGDVLTFTSTGLTDGTTYYFKIRSFAAGIILSESAAVNATPVSSTTPPPSPSPNVGGGNGNNVVTTGANFSGIAYPGSNVYLLKDGQIAAVTVAGGDANFKISLTGLSAGNFLFLIYAVDQAGRRSTLFTFPVTLTIGATSDIGGIFIAPTIAVDKEEVKKGDNITILGQSAPNGQVSISVHSNPEIFVQTTSDKIGEYLYNFDTSVLDMGNHLTKSKVAQSDLISQFGESLAFKVGDQNIFAAAPVLSPTSGGVCNGIGDLNHDCKVNLVDYSILAFWYKKNSPPADVDLNHDGIVNIVDFSILAHYWTG